MHTSREWRTYFEQNAKSLLVIPWDGGADLAADERAAIARSLAEFQAGESSEGRHLLQYAREYAERANDPDYVEAIRLFIGEEQRHARDLGRFLRLNSIELISSTFTDRVFRRLRRVFSGLEISIAVLVTAELIAKVYYAALSEATESRVLRRLCEQILNDEQKHVEFQIDYLGKLRAGRSWPVRMLTMGMQRFLYFGTTYVVWIFHKKVFRRAGLTLASYRKWCRKVFGEAFAVGAGRRASDRALKCPATIARVATATQGPAGRVGEVGRSVSGS